MSENQHSVLVSILLPTYNGANYIKEFLESIKRQDYRPIELIISDDNSTDNTLSIIKHWIHKNGVDIHTRLIVGKKNLGLSGNFSRMRHHISGNYIFIADQDDIWEANKITEQVNYLNKNTDCIMCICDRSIIDSKGKTLCRSEASFYNRKKKKMKFNQIICEPSIYAANCMALRNKYLDNIFSVPEKIVEHDTYMTIIASYYGDIGFLQKPLIRYRIHNNNLSGSFVIETNKNIIRCFIARLKVNNKINRTKLNDGIIIADILQKKYNIDIYKTNNKLINYKVENVYLTSFLDIIKAITDKKLNYFYKN